MTESWYDREPGYALRYRDRRWVTGSGTGTDRGERRALRRFVGEQTPALALPVAEER